MAQRVMPALVAQHEANFKAVNILFSGLGPNEYERDGVVPRVATSWSDSELYRLWYEPMLSPIGTRPTGSDSDVRIRYAQLDLYQDSDT